MIHPKHSVSRVLRILVLLSLLTTAIISSWLYLSHRNASAGGFSEKIQNEKGLTQLSYSPCQLSSEKKQIQQKQRSNLTTPNLLPIDPHNKRQDAHQTSKQPHQNNKTAIVRLLASCSASSYCPAGQYCSATTCTTCPAGQFCAGNNAAAGCGSGYYQPSTGQAFCLVCAVGTYSQSPFTACIASPAGAYAPGGMNFQQCPQGTFLASSGNTYSTQCTACPPGQYSTGSQATSCVACAAGQFCTGASSYTTCGGGGYISAVSKTSVTDCQWCVPGMQTGASSTACSTTCATNIICVGGSSPSSLTCPAGTYSSAGGVSVYTQCTATCTPGFQMVTGTCGACIAGRVCLGVVGQASCPAGTFGTVAANSYSVCQPCAAGTSSTGSASTCPSCAAGGYCPGGTNILTCPAGRYSTAGTGQSSATVCQTTLPGSFTTSTGSTATATCTANYHCPGGINRQLCPVGSYPSSSATGLSTAAHCLPCAAGSYTSSAGTPCNSCPVGYYCPGGNVQIACPLGTYSLASSATDASVCVSCAVGYQPFSLGGCVPCSTNGYCPGGASARVVCPAGWSSITGSASSPTACLPCAAGTYSGTHCTICTAGSYCPGASNAIQCAPGSANPTTVATTGAACIACPSSYFSINAGNACFYCNAGYYCPGGSSYIMCPGGTYGGAGGASSAVTCSVCPVGRFSSGGSALRCDVCSAGYYCPGGSDQLPCDAGWVNPNAASTSAATCTVCPPGKYSSTTAGLAMCSVCTPGFFCPGGVDRVQCPAGYYSTEAAATAMASCLPCAPGYYSAKSTAGAIGCINCLAGNYCPGAVDKQACPAGTMSTATTQSSPDTCIACPVGSYSAPGSVFCSACSPGSWCPGGTNRITCLAGYYSTATGATSIDTCLPCGAGYYTLEGGIACQPCLAGQFCPGSASFTLCGQGKLSTVVRASTSADCQTCAPGTYSDVSALGCSPCPSGAYCPGNSYFIACPVGKYSKGVSASDETSCLSCPGGTYTTDSVANKPGATFCATCPSGYYCSGGVDKLLCPAGKVSLTTGASSNAACSTVCTAGTYSYGGILCVPCLPGSYCPAGVLIPCPAGKYATATGATTDICIPCAAGYYQDTAGSISCSTPCVVGANTGSTGAASCSCLAGYYCPNPYTQVICPAGTYSETGSTACTPCTPPLISQAGAAVCYSPETPKPSPLPTIEPTIQPTIVPTASPSVMPSALPSVTPTIAPSALPSLAPTMGPSAKPSTSCPTSQPSSQPSAIPTIQPSHCPSSQPSADPSSQPSAQPSLQPSNQPSRQPSSQPSSQPVTRPTTQPSTYPTSQPSSQPLACPTCQPSSQPTGQPSRQPSAQPSNLPTSQPSTRPSTQPSGSPTTQPSSQPSWQPSTRPSAQPSAQPSSQPSVQPTCQPSRQPSGRPSIQPSGSPTSQPSDHPSAQPTRKPSAQPSSQPISKPSAQPSRQPTSQPSSQPSSYPSRQPSVHPSAQPSTQPTSQPSRQPSRQPSAQPSMSPTTQPTMTPSLQPSGIPSTQPSDQPSHTPSAQPSSKPSLKPSLQPSAEPSTQPSTQPSTRPSMQPTSQPSSFPSGQPTQEPTSQPSTQPTAMPSSQPSSLPSAQPSSEPSGLPTSQPSAHPSSQPSRQPTNRPLREPSCQPTGQPSFQPSCSPTTQPSSQPSCQPTAQPNACPTSCPSIQPSAHPTSQPSVQPSSNPSGQPSNRPSSQPSSRPSVQPSTQPSMQPRSLPTSQPVANPSTQPSSQPSSQPSAQPLCRPSSQPSRQPSSQPSRNPTGQPVSRPSSEPSSRPSRKMRLSFGTLPSNSTISVLIDDQSSGGPFKLVLPFQKTSSVSGNGFYNVQGAALSVGINYVIFGNKTMPNAINLLAQSTNTLPVAMVSPAVGLDGSGRSVSNAGDINGDGYDDLIIGVPYAARCYVLFGTSQGFRQMTDGFTIFGAQSSDLTGWSVSGAGDVNNDTFTDIVIGAPYGSGDATSSGVVYVLYGKYQGFEDIHLSSLSATDGFAVHGSSVLDTLGMSVSSAGDVNGDGIDDVVMSALKIGNAGEVYVLYGAPEGIPHNTVKLSALTPSIGIKFTGAANNWIGYSVSGASDVNGDGFDDILIGSVPTRGVQISYLVFGGPSLSNTALTTLTAAKGVVLSGGGVVVQALGDLNGDGCADFMVGSDYGFSGSGYVVPLTVSHVVPTVKGTDAPTPAPSPAPTQPPTTLPTVLPTAPPTMLSSSSNNDTSQSLKPTVEPTEIGTEPTLEPSHTPSQEPSIEPSVAPSIAPTAEPTRNTSKPTIAPTTTAVPTVRPSFRPVVDNTDPPVVARSTDAPLRRPSRTPVQPPTLSPHVRYTQRIVTSGGVVRQRGYENMNYIVNASSDVSFTGEGSWCTYTVLPMVSAPAHSTMRAMSAAATTAVYTIESFNTQHDLINLQAFSHILSYKDLNITAGSVIITLSEKQTVRLLGLRPSDVSAKHFVFFDPSSVRPPTDENSSRKSNNNSGGNFVMVVLSGLVAIGTAGVLFALCLAMQRENSSYKKKIEKQAATDRVGETQRDGTYVPSSKVKEKTFEELDQTGVFQFTFDVRTGSNQSNLLSEMSSEVNISGWTSSNSAQSSHSSYSKMSCDSAGSGLDTGSGDGSSYNSSVFTPLHSDEEESRISRSRSGGNSFISDNNQSQHHQHQQQRWQQETNDDDDDDDDDDDIVSFDSDLLSSHTGGAAAADSENEHAMNDACPSPSLYIGCAGGRDHPNADSRCNEDADIGSYKVRGGDNNSSDISSVISFDSDLTN